MEIKLKLNTYEEALADVRSAIRFHIETFGEEVLEGHLTLPNHARIKGSTLRTICTQSGIGRDEFLKAYEQS